MNSDTSHSSLQSILQPSLPASQDAITEQTRVKEHSLIAGWYLELLQLYLRKKELHLRSHPEAEKSWLPSKAYVLRKNWSSKEHGESSLTVSHLFGFFWNPEFLETSVKPQALHWLIYLSWSEEMPVKAEVLATECPGRQSPALRAEGYKAKWSASSTYPD